MIDMPGKFCPKCGAQEVDFYEGLCVKCYKEEEEFTESPKEISVKECKDCGYWLYRGKWKKPTEDVVKNMVKNSFKTKLNRPTYRIEVAENEINVSLKGNVDPQGLIQKKENYSIPFKLGKDLCPVCNKVRCQSHKVKVQLRRSDEDPNEKKFDRIDRFITKEVGRMMSWNHKSLAFWKEEAEEGINYCFGYKDPADRVKRLVKKKFKVNVRVHVRKAGRARDGKKKAKLTYKIRV